MKSMMLRMTLSVCVLVAMTLVVAGDASAQCATCPTATVAYSPVVAAQPSLAYQPYTGWYPGKWIDQWRLSRAGVAAAPAYSAGYAPTYTAAYAPRYTAAYAPRYTAAYTTAYAPTACASPVYQAAYRPYVTAYAPLTRRVLLRPVVVAPAACNTCSYTPSCACNSCSTGVSQAVYSDTGCSSCGVSAAQNVVPSGSLGVPVRGPNVGPQTSAPTYNLVPTPATSPYESEKPLGKADDEEHSHEPAADEADANTYNAPRLLMPTDRTAMRSYQSRQPTVNVWTAVHRQASRPRAATPVSAKRVRTQEEIDAEGWTAVKRSNR